MSPEDALGRLKPPALERDPQLIRKAMPLIRDWESLSYSLAAEGRHTAALRLVDELEACDRSAEARSLRRIMNDAGYRMPDLAVGATESPKARTATPSPDDDPALDRLHDR